MTLDLYFCKLLAPLIPVGSNFASLSDIFSIRDQSQKSLFSPSSPILLLYFPKVFLNHVSSSKTLGNHEHILWRENLGKHQNRGGALLPTRAFSIGLALGSVGIMESRAELR